MIFKKDILIVLVKVFSVQEQLTRQLISYGKKDYLVMDLINHTGWLIVLKLK